MDHVKHRPLTHTIVALLLVLKHSLVSEVLVLKVVLSICV